ncbi:MAG: hypothetical protein ACM3XO_15335, partial [Bacteroidota bacterium]
MNVLSRGLTICALALVLISSSVTSFVGMLLLTIGLSGCDKKSGEAVVLAKEHIDAALPTAETPNAGSEPGPTAEIRPMADDEIAVDGYV